MDKLINKINKLSLPTTILILGIILGWLFYWFQIRPAKLRKECQKWAYDTGMEYFYYEPMRQVTDLVKKGQLQTEYMDGAYTRCVRSKGLK